jgi:hypothetical protein
VLNFTIYKFVIRALLALIFSLNVAVENGGRQNVDLELEIHRVIANLNLVPLELDWKPTALHRI